jgi:hypothetical protein
MLVQEDQWVGEAITHARIAYECWSGLVSGMFKIAPESSPSLLGGSYVNVFADYSKKEFLRYVSVLHRGFLDQGKKTDAALRIQQEVTEAQIDKLIGLAAPLLRLRNKEEHRENPIHPQVWSVSYFPLRPMVGTQADGYIDPFPVYQILVLLEPAIGHVAFVKSRLEESRLIEPSKENEP